MALGDEAYRRLKDDIRVGRYSAGERLALAALAEQFGMSITPIRDGVARLVAERLLVALPNRSVCIPVPSVESIIEVRRVRRELEGLAAHSAGGNITTAELEQIAACHARFQGADAAGDTAEMQSSNSAFHFLIYRAANMPILLDTIETYWIRDAPAQKLLYDNQSNLVRSANRHQQIIDSLWRRDPDAARAELMLDIGDVTQAVATLAARAAMPEL